MFGYKFRTNYAFRKNFIHVCNCFEVVNFCFWFQIVAMQLNKNLLYYMSLNRFSSNFLYEVLEYDRTDMVIW